MPKTKIEWTDHSWPVLNGCRRVSPGCINCYAERLTATRLRQTDKYRGLAIYGEHGPRWTGKSRLWAKELAMPIRLRKPSRIFVCDMGDLFFEENSNEEIAAVFGIMAAAPQHTFQVLTKRSKRMREWFAWIATASPASGMGESTPASVCNDAAVWACTVDEAFPDQLTGYRRVWPLPNVHLGVSAEDQQRANERISDLLETPAAVRFVSYEPALGPVDFRRYIAPQSHCRACGEWTPGTPSICPRCQTDNLFTAWGDHQHEAEATLEQPDDGPDLSWIIVGGESGPGARPFDVAWARSTVEQCRKAGVPVFVKQLGAKPYETHSPSYRGIGSTELHLKDRKGGDMAEWSEDLRIREFPKARP